MAQFYSLQKPQTGRSFPVSGVGLGGRTSHHARGEFTATTAFTTADFVDMFDLPPRARVIGGFIKATDMDSNGAPTITLNVGIVGTPQLFFAAANVAQAGGVLATLTTAGYDYVTTGKTPVRLVPQANAATFAAGTIIVVLDYIVEEPA